MAGLGQFRWQKCLCLHFCCQTQIQIYLCNINLPTPCRMSYFNSTMEHLCFLFLLIAHDFTWIFTTILFQVADGRGNCTPHRNPTPCTIPQDRESIFHTIFAFFTKSGRKVLVNKQPATCTLTFQRSLTVSPLWGFLIFVSRHNICLSHFSLPHTFPCSFLTFRFSFFFPNKGLRPTWKSVHDNLLLSGSTVNRRSSEHRYKTPTQHWNS